MSEAHFVLICEGPTDDWVVRKLADRVFWERGASWIHDVGLDSLRVWCGVEPNTPFTKWTKVKALAKEVKLRSLGHIRGEPQHADAAMVWKAIQLVRLEKRRGRIRADALLLVRDVDKQTDRITGAAQALDAADGQEDPLQIITSWVCPKIEAWILHGFVARDDHEKERWQQTRDELGFDPVLEAHQLDKARESTGELAKRSAKRVVDVLCDATHERQEACILDSDLDRLSEHGGRTGLAAYLEDVSRKLLPLVERGSR